MATSLNISLPKELKDFVVREVARGGYGTASEYIREILRGEVEKRSREDLERRLLEGLATPGTEMTGADWKRLRDRIRARARSR
jgi:antitoxin ParD1/3/4